MKLRIKICSTGFFAVASKEINLIRFLNFDIRGLLEKYPTFGREKETGLLGALDT